MNLEDNLKIMEEIKKESVSIFQDNNLKEHFFINFNIFRNIL